jgi:hypothetical protein
MLTAIKRKKDHSADLMRPATPRLVKHASTTETHSAKSNIDCKCVRVMRPPGNQSFLPVAIS